MFIALQEVEHKIQPKEALDDLVDDQQHPVTGIGKRSIKHGSYAGVADQKEYHNIENGLPLAVGLDDNSFFECLLFALILIVILHLVLPERAVPIVVQGRRLEDSGQSAGAIEHLPFPLLLVVLVVDDCGLGHSFLRCLVFGRA